MVGLPKAKFFTLASNCTTPVLVSKAAITVLFSAFAWLSMAVVASKATTAEVVTFLWAKRKKVTNNKIVDKSVLYY